MKLMHVLAASIMAVVVWAPASAQQSTDTLVVAFPREVLTTDGLYSTLRENDILGLLVDDALYYVDPETQQPVPLVARSHEFVDDTTLVITLRDDVTFHDGTPLTAEDVVYSFNHIVSEEGQTRYATRIGRWMESVEALDDHTVQFNMLHPYAMVLYDLSYYSKLRRVGSYEIDGVTTPEAQQNQVNGTGPYRIVDFQPGQRIELELYDGYREDSPKAVASIRNIVIRIIPDFSTQAAEVMAGGVHWTFNVPTVIAENVGLSGRAQFLAGPSMRVGYVSLDAAGRSDPDVPTTDIRVRQALNHAIDREAIVRNITGGTAEPLWTACQPIQFGCTQDVVRYEYDPERARALLAEAGYPDGFELEYWAARDRPIQEAIVNYWRDIGVDATLRYVRSASMPQPRDAGQLTAYYSSSGSYSIPDAGAILPDRFMVDMARVYTGDAELSDLIGRANATYDAAERERLMHEAVRYIAEQAYWVPIQKYTQNFMISNDLEYEQADDGMPRLFTARWR